MAWMLWLLTVFFVIAGTWLVWERKKKAQLPLPRLEGPGISILKPLKGVDSGLEENLRSFFGIRYPNFEIIFSVAEANDPAVVVIRKLIQMFPDVRARLLIGAEDVGLNPKVNNITRSYRSAAYDVVLISDSNVRVCSDYLWKKVSHLKDGVGVVTATVAGLQPQGWGGRLEAVYLNTFYARGMDLAFKIGKPCVIGKSMMFRRSVADQFGGIAALGNYLAEDYALGEEMQKLGLSVELADENIDQFIGEYSLRNFWDRHLRWGRIRKAHAPLAFLAEPLTSPLVGSIIAATALSTWIPFELTFLMNVLIWAGCDFALMGMASGKVAKWYPIAWIFRELLALPLWLAVASGNTVNWRGNSLTLCSGGKIKGREHGCASNLSSGVPLPARIRLRGTTYTAIGGSGRPRAILREG